jgi:putative SOS response-associated peptidase YedK
MCGRFSLASRATQVAKQFGVAHLATHGHRYNIAPLQEAVVVVCQQSIRRAALMRWGLVPSWASDPASGQKMINARSETASDKPAFRTAFRQRRCLVPVDGFYEWEHEGRQKRPWRFCRRDRNPFALAGMWEEWRGPGHSPWQTFTILTTSANALLARMHDRMPVIIPPEQYAFWLDEAETDPVRLRPLLVPCPTESMEGYPVNPVVNHPAQDVPLCFEPAGTTEQGMLF